MSLVCHIRVKVKWDLESVGSLLRVDTKEAMSCVHTTPPSLKGGPINRRALLRVTLAIAIAASWTAAAVHYVDGSSSNTTRDGTSWATCFTDLQAALSAAAQGDQIWVAAGTYKPTTATDRAATFTIKRGVAMFGGFTGTETDTSERDWSANATILSGDIGTADLNTDNSYHVLTMEQYATLDGFTVTGGCANGSSDNSQKRGAGIYAVNVSPFIRNCTVQNNSASIDGGGLYLSGGTATLENCTFSSNTCGSDGGAVHATSDAGLTVRRCAFTDNAALGGYASGGAVCCEGAAFSFDTCTFSGNRASDGGAVSAGNATSLTLTGCTFSGDSATDIAGALWTRATTSVIKACTFENCRSADDGGAVYVSDGGVSVSGCTFSGNRVSYNIYDEPSDGGAVYANGGTIAVISCTFSTNRAPGVGGALYLSSSCNGLTLDTCTFSRNSADWGGSIYTNSTNSVKISNSTFTADTAKTMGAAIQVRSGSPEISACVFTKNDADYHGGAVAVAKSTTPSFTNCTFSNNKAFELGGAMFIDTSAAPALINCSFGGNSTFQNGGALYCMSQSAPVAKNCVFWGNTVTSSGTDVKAEIGGESSAASVVTYSCIDQTKTISAEAASNIGDDPLFQNAAADSLQLQATSPCIDAGTSEGAPDTDLIGRARPFGDAVDMGAYESRGVNRTPVISADAVPDIDEGDTLLLTIGMLTVEDTIDVFPDDYTLITPVDTQTNYVAHKLCDTAYVITPFTAFTGELSIPVQVRDFEDTSATYTVAVTVTEIDDPPVAVDDEYTTVEETALTEAAPGVLANDSDPESATITVAGIADSAAYGEVAIESDGSFTYTPEDDFSGVDLFSYVVSDGNGVDTAEVAILVTNTEDAPVGADDAFAMLVGDTLLCDTVSVLDNDIDPDGLGVFVSDLVSDAATGDLVLALDGTFSYVPPTDFAGVDSFAYELTNGSGMSDTATVLIEVAHPNRAPVATADTYTTAEDQELSDEAPGLLANDSDEDNDTLTVVAVPDSATHGTLTWSSDGSFTYTPEADYHGSDSFRYVASDGNEDDTATVTLTVTAVNDTPTITAVEDDTANADEEWTVTVAAQDADSADQLTFSLVSPPTGMAIDETGGTITWMPEQSHEGEHTIVVEVADGEGAVAADTFSLVVQISVAVAEDRSSVPAGKRRVLLAAAPNPAKLGGEGVFFQVPLEGMADVWVRVYDAVGNLVYTGEFDRVIGNGAAVVGPWNLLTVHGNRTAPGTYLAVVTIAYADGERSVSRIKVGVTD